MLFFNDHDLLSRMTALILVHKHWTWNRKQYPIMLLILYVHMCWASYPQFWWMGVKGLWRVLQPIKEKVLVSSLRGKVLAVDLAIWVVQSETVTNNELQKIYLRQMFYKVKFMCIGQQINYILGICINPVSHCYQLDLCWLPLCGNCLRALFIDVEIWRSVFHKSLSHQISNPDKSPAGTRCGYHHCYWWACTAPQSSYHCQETWSGTWQEQQGW